MNNSSLLNIIRTLSPVEQREFGKFLHSSFFNTRKDVIELWEYIEKKPQHLLRKAEAAKAISPQKTISDQQFRLTMSYLYKILEKYLALKCHYENSLDDTLSLARAYRKRNMEKAFNKAISKAKLILEKRPFRNIHYLQSVYKIEFEDYANLAKKERTLDKNLQQVADTLDEAYVAERLRTACLQLSQQDVAKKEYNLGMLPVIISFLQENPSMLNVPAIAIYFHYYQAKREKNKEEYHFKRLLFLIFEHGNLFPSEDIRDIYRLTLNYYISKINTGEMKFIRNSLDLYKLGFQQNILVENGELSRFTYKNAVALALRLKEFDWAEQFIVDYKPLIALDHRTTYFNYNLGKLYQEKKEYKKAMPLFQQVVSKDTMLILGTKTAQLKISYMISEIELFHSILESLRMFIRRKKSELSEEHLTPFLLFVKFCTRLTQINPYDKESIQKLKKDLKQTTTFSEKNWLMEQIDQL